MGFIFFGPGLIANHISTQKSGFQSIYYFAAWIAPMSGLQGGVSGKTNLFLLLSPKRCTYFPTDGTPRIFHRKISVFTQSL